MKFPTCRNIVASWSESLDRPVSLGERLLLWAHCLLCRPCRRYMAQTQAVRESAGRALHADSEEADSSAPQLSPEARDRIRQAAEEAARETR